MGKYSIFHKELTQLWQGWWIFQFTQRNSRCEVSKNYLECWNIIQKKITFYPFNFYRFKVQTDHVNSNNIDPNNKLNHKIGQIISRNNTPGYKSTVPARNKPLYHNCYLEAPDGEILCTCDKKKAEWYVTKELGEVVEENPFTVRLKFEPSGRALGEVGKYYTQIKLNQCVVCGTSDKFIRKNVVPREYRKYFPREYFAQYKLNNFK